MLETLGKRLLGRILLGAFCVGMIAHPVYAQDKHLYFAARHWTVRPAGVGTPGPNHWDPQNVWVDKQGFLHLLLAPRKGIWTSVEIYTDELLGFGDYQFQIEGRLDKLDRNVVLGLFSYPASAPSETHEIDIEFSRWAIPTAPMLNYTVWPAVPKHKGQQVKSFDFTMKGAAVKNSAAKKFESTHIYRRLPHKIEFLSVPGLNPSSSSRYGQWTFQPPAAEQNERISQLAMPLHINLWCVEGKPPGDGKPVEIVIRNFKFRPLPVQKKH